MLYRALKCLIERGQTDGLALKIDILFKGGKLTQAQYEELSGMLEGQA